MRLINIVLDLFSPISCLFCKKKDEALCSECLSLIPKTSRECENWVFPIYDYRDTRVKNVIYKIKYRGEKILIPIFAKILYPIILEKLSEFKDFNKPVFLPIPLSYIRLHKRGFNQSLVLCQELIKLDKQKIFELQKDNLIKTRGAIHQTDIKNRNERLKNIIGSFLIKKPEKIKNRNIILIDDVVTTGATLSEARKILKKTGAKKIIAFTIAH